MAEVRDDARLFLGHDKAGRDGVELKAELLPDSEALADILRGVVDVELGVVERIGNEGRRQVVNAIAHVRQHRQHGGKRDLAVTAHIVDQQQLSVLHECPLGSARRGSATVRLSVAQGTLRAKSGSVKGKLLQKGYGKEVSRLGRS